MKIKTIKSQLTNAAGLRADYGSNPNTYKTEQSSLSNVKTRAKYSFFVSESSSSSYSVTSSQAIYRDINFRKA